MSFELLRYCEHSPEKAIELLKNSNLPQTVINDCFVAACNSETAHLELVKILVQDFKAQVRCYNGVAFKYAFCKNHRELLSFLLIETNILTREAKLWMGMLGIKDREAFVLELDKTKKEKKRLDSEIVSQMVNKRINKL